MSAPCVYGLIDPRTGAVHYIGASKNLYKRVYSHWSNGTRAKAVDDWFSDLRKNGLKFEVRILETTTVDRLEIAERLWIAHAASLRWPLTNATRGGKGPLGCVMPARTDEWRAEHSARLTGRPRSAATRAKMAVAQKARRAREGITDAS